MEEEKDDFRLKLPPALKKELGALFEKRGIDRTKASKRIMSWFLRQQQVIQQHILGQLPDENEADIAQMILNQMAGVAKSASGYEDDDIFEEKHRALEAEP